MLKDALDELGRKILRDARFNLKRVKKGNSSLYKSMKFKTEKNSIVFTLPDYWEYVDAGVKGVGGTKADGSRWKTKKVTNSKFKYRDKMPPLMAFNGWSIKKKIAPISKSVYHTGIATTDFFSEPVETNVNKMAENIAESLANELIDNIIIE